MGIEKKSPLQTGFAFSRVTRPDETCFTLDATVDPDTGMSLVLYYDPNGYSAFAGGTKFVLMRSQVFMGYFAESHYIPAPEHHTVFGVPIIETVPERIKLSGWEYRVVIPPKRITADGVPVVLATTTGQRSVYRVVDWNLIVGGAA